MLRFQDATFCQGPELGYRVEAAKAHLRGVGLRVAVVMSFDSRLTHEDDHVPERQRGHTSQPSCSGQSRGFLGIGVWEEMTPDQEGGRLVSPRLDWEWMTQAGWDGWETWTAASTRS